MEQSKQGKFYPIRKNVMTSCHGPCDQGRDQCPTPWACERDEPYEDPRWHYLPEFVVAAAMVAVLLFSWWVAK